MREQKGKKPNACEAAAAGSEAARQGEGEGEGEGRPYTRVWKQPSVKPFYGRKREDERSV